MKVIVKRQTTASIFRAQVDGIEMQFDASGTAIAIEGSGQHNLTWQVVGAEGDTYSIAITDPAGQCSHNGTLGNEQHDEGDCPFFV